MSDFFDDIPDEVLDGEPEENPTSNVDKIIQEAQSLDAIEPISLQQEDLVAYMIQNNDVWVQVQSIIKLEYFEPVYAKVIKHVQTYYKEYGYLPPLGRVHAKTGVRIPIAEHADRKDVVEDVLKDIETFCQQGAGYLLVQAAVDYYAEHGALPREYVSGPLLKKMEDVTRISLRSDLGIDVYEDAEEYLEKDKEFGAIPIGIGFLDTAFGGGVAKPSMNVVSAASGQGKSIFLQNIAFLYAAAGHHVVFYTLELEYPTIMRRFSAIITNTHIDLIPDNIKSVAHQLHTMGKHQGAIKVKKFPMSRTTIDNVAAHYKDLTLETELEFDVVCIDYIDVMGSTDKSIKRGEIHVKDKDISEEMNNFFHDNMIIGWTASQQTKTAVEEKELKSSNVSGGRSKVDTSDNLIMLRRNEEERGEDRFWAIIRKARSSGAVNSQIPLNWDPGTQRMTDGDYDLFVKENAHIFGRKSFEMREKDKRLSDTVKKDPIAKAAGLDNVGKDRPISAKTASAEVIRARMKKAKNAGKKDDGERTEQS